MKHRYQKLTPDQVRTAIELYRNGWSMPQLAARYGVRKSAIWHMLHVRGVPTRPRHTKRFVRSNPDTPTNEERDLAGCTCTLVRLEDGVKHTKHVQGKARDSLRAVAGWCDEMYGDWRLLSYSTPLTIMGDLGGMRANVSEHDRINTAQSMPVLRNHDATPELLALSKIGRRDLLHPSLDR